MVLDSLHGADTTALVYDGQINGKVKILLGEGKAEDVKAGVEEDPEAEVAIACPLCGAMFDMRTGERFVAVLHGFPPPDEVPRIERFTSLHSDAHDPGSCSMTVPRCSGTKHALYYEFHPFRSNCAGQLYGRNAAGGTCAPRLLL